MFLKSIDGTTAHFRSEGDDFRDALRLEGTCPAPTVDQRRGYCDRKVADHRPHACRGGLRERLPLWRSSVIPGPNTLTLLQSLTTILTGGNILLNRDAGTPAGVGSVLTFPAIEGFADRLLGPSECVTVTYKIGLATAATFDFFVDVLGDIVEPMVPANTMAQTARVTANRSGDGQKAQSIRLFPGDHSLECNLDCNK